jgi:hypothetical protein
VTSLVSRTVTVITAATATAVLALTACGSPPAVSTASGSGGPASTAGQPAGQAPASIAPPSPLAGPALASGPGNKGPGSTPAASTAPAGPPPASPPARCGHPTVSTADQLSQALAAAAPGTTIVLAAGDYSGNFTGTASGTAAQPVTLCGPRTAVLDGGPVSSGYTFHLDHANWWRVEGFSVTGGQKGLVTDSSEHDLIDGLSVHGIGDEAIHLRDFSSYDTVSQNEIRGTGLNSSFYGEGIYIGSAHSNWCEYSGCQPDASDHDAITANNIAQTTAENIDIKEGTAGGTISGNHLNGSGMVASAATSWVNVKGNDWKITGNTGTDSVKDGLSDHQVYAGWGLDNVFTGNTLSVNGPGYGIYIQSKRLASVVACDNKVTGAQLGLSNAACGSAG